MAYRHAINGQGEVSADDEEILGWFLKCWNATLKLADQGPTN
jgi:hypothetical protein